MNFLRQQRIRLRFILAAVFILALTAIVRSKLLPSTNKRTMPSLIEVFVKQEKDVRKVQIREPKAITLFQTILTGGKTIEDQPLLRSKYEILIHGGDKKSQNDAPAPVWQTANGRFAWMHDDQATELNGSLPDFIDWHTIRSVNQILQHRDPERKQIGEQLREESWSKYVETLLRIANSTNALFAQSAIQEINEFISIEPAKQNQLLSEETRSSNRRIISDPGRRVRDELVRLVARHPQVIHADDQFKTSYLALQCLQQIGDRKTADALVKQLKKFQQGELSREVLTTIERLYGIPDTYERLYLCGNSSDKELADFQREEAERQSVAIDDLLAWQKDHVDDSREEFYDAIVLRWSEVLNHLSMIPNSHQYGDRTPASKVKVLSDLGKPIVPALQRRKQAATDWGEIAMLEFCVAILTGECDSDLVTELLAGDFAQQRLACCIISAAADSSWNDSLVKLLRTPFDTSRRNLIKILALRDIAAQAMFRSRGIEAFPEFRSAQKEGFHSGMISRILEHGKIPEY